jgi:hypothetical protein
MKYYYIIVQPTITNYKIIYGSNLLDNITNYINENNLNEDYKILQYNLQENDNYCEVRNEHLFIYNKPENEVKPIQENFYKYTWLIDNIIEKLRDIDFRESQTFIPENEYKEELLKEKEYIEKKVKYYDEEYDKLYEVYGKCGNKIDEKFIVVE